MPPKQEVNTIIRFNIIMPKIITGHKFCGVLFMLDSCGVKPVCILELQADMSCSA